MEQETLKIEYNKPFSGFNLETLMKELLPPQPVFPIATLSDKLTSYSKDEGITVVIGNWSVEPKEG